MDTVQAGKEDVIVAKGAASDAKTSAKTNGGVE